MKILKKEYFKQTSFYLLFFVIILYQNFLLIFSKTAGDEIFHLSKFGHRIQVFNKFIDLWISKVVYWLLQGDISPLDLLITLTFNNYLNDNIFFLKIFYLFLLILSVFLFSYLVYLITEDKNFAALVLVTISLCFQYQKWHDAFIIFPLYVMPLFIFLISTTIFFVKYLKNNNNFYFYISMLFIFLSCLMSPVIVAPFLPTFLLFNFFFKKKLFDKKLFTFYLIPSLFVLGVIYLKFFVTVDSQLYKDLSLYTIDPAIYSGRVFVKDPSMMIKSFFIQLSSTIPLIFLLRDNYHFIQNLEYFYSISIFDIIYFFLYSFLLFKILKKKILINNCRIFLILFSTILIFVAFPVLLSEKYVTTLQTKGVGYGYIYNFYQFFGTNILLIILVLFILNKFNYNFKTVVFFSVFISLIGTLTIIHNRNFIEQSFRYGNEETQAYLNAKRQEFFTNIPEFSNVFYETSVLSFTNTPAFMAEVIKKRVFSSWYDTRFQDYKFNNSKLFLNKKNYLTTRYILDEINLEEEKKNIYKFIKSKKENINYSLFGDLKIKKINLKVVSTDEKKKIYLNSDKVFLVKSFLVNDDILILNAELKNVIIKDSLIDNFIIKKFKIFSKKKNSNIFEGSKIDLNSLLNKIEFYNGFDFKLQSDYDKNNFYKIKYYQKKNNIVFNSYYNGSIKCSTKELRKKNRNFWLPISKSHQQNTSLLLEINNNSSNDWKINNFKFKNPVTLRILLRNTKTNKARPGPGISFTKINVDSGHSINYYFNQLEIARIISLVKWYKADQIEFHLTHEGKRFFSSDDKLFEPCKIKLVD